MNITAALKGLMNVENCDILNENGKLRLVYDLEEFSTPLTLVHANSYHELNEKAMRIFDPKDWMRFLVDESIGVSTSSLHPLVADMFKNHHDVYESIISGSYLNKLMEDSRNQQVEEEYDMSDGYLTLIETGEKDERGHRMARFDVNDLKKMDYDMLVALGRALAVPDVDILGPNDLAYSISLQDIDIDDADCDFNCEDCEYGEMTDDGNCICNWDGEEDEEDVEDDEDLCDGDCEHCKYDAPEIDSGCSWTPEENEVATQSDVQSEAQQYEYVDGPAHYHGTECIENMRKLFGDEAVRWFCICNAYKYRFRDGSKPGVSEEQDEEKARWYEDYVVKMRSEQTYY